MDKCGEALIMAIPAGNELGTIRSGTLEFEHTSAPAPLHWSAIPRRGSGAIASWIEWTAPVREDKGCPKGAGHDRRVNESAL